MSSPASNPNKVEYEEQAFLLAGAVLGTGLVSRYYGMPMLGVDTFGVVALSMAGNAVYPVKYGLAGLAAGGLGASMLLGKEPMVGVAMAAGAMLGTQAATYLMIEYMFGKIKL